MALDALACYDEHGRHTHPHLDLSRQPTGLRRQRVGPGQHVLIDVEASAPCGRRVSTITPGIDVDR